MTICDKNHRYADILNNLPPSQSYDNGRHLCTGCALEAGFSDGLNGIRRQLENLNLPESQAGTGRHKSAQAAYDLGYKKAQDGQSL
ncbi:hypothetical protein [Haemophilus pittmaniae]|uniref:hypothetical protein n=1 Tax=Haemophilus pittmaniae TaxID=249188 RepID=UPI00058693F1|nr:hypothetical protein [Haemophilus pittmaniae]SNV86402.1 Uncharacterised protein [Haemophilus pittmaniae]